MDRYNSPECKAIEEAIDALGIPSHVEVNDGFLSITILGTRSVIWRLQAGPVTQEQSRGGSTIEIKIPK
jgi:hypothetical protein